MKLGGLETHLEKKTPLSNSERFRDTLIWARRLGLVIVLEMHARQMFKKSSLDSLTDEEQGAIADTVRPTMVHAIVREKSLQ